MVTRLRPYEFIFFHLDKMEIRATISCMGMREDLLKRIERKQQEIRELELSLRDCTTYVQALQDAMKLLPRSDGGDTTDEPVLRVGTDLSKARDAILKVGRPMHITEIVKAIGKPSDKRTKVALVGGIGRYARKNQVFTKTAPNTFGLLELQSIRLHAKTEPPDDFGTLIQHDKGTA
jgi:hypothetical protein